MAIVKLKKITFCGMLSDKRRILEQVQALGGLHLIPLAEPPGQEFGAPKNTEGVVEALKYLNACANKRHQIKDATRFDLERITEEVLAIKAKVRELTDIYDALSKRIDEVEPWGDFQLPETAQLAGYRLWFYIIPKRMMKKLEDCDWVWQTVYQNNLYCYVVVVAESEPPENSMPVARTHTGSIPLSTLKTQRSQVELTLEDLQAERESLTRWITLMTVHFSEALDQADLAKAQTITRDEAGVFALQGWLPEAHTEKFLRFAEHHGLAVLVEDPDPGDNPPTLLDNPRQLAGGEDIVNFYQTPNYYGWDPSIVVFFSFSVFFAMILSDAGYAAVFGLILMFKWRSLGQSLKGRRLRVLAANTVVISLVWGVISGGYFGYSPPEERLVSALKIIDINDFDGMMRLSIAVGVGHIALANAIRAYRRYPSLTALASIGWLLAVVGGFCFWLSATTDNDGLRQVGIILPATGGVLLLLFSSERGLKRWSDLFWRLLDGVKSLIGITQLFGDVLSYMRLFALGLASASLALTFNQLAVQVYHALPGPGLLFSILILIVGHVLNLMLCLMSGLVHGLRLNFIEFYNWSVSDEGYPFKAFSKKGVR
ncbi:V-type ATP synthase subunit I [Methylotuvimicrobium alcaliphilum]|uniref:H+-transporting ATP synthase, subunit I (AtpI) n=1 Tax=Methylotuvimicrobium alcaliphilum (strain DSM 19304 / NCIMB 14124 / VKM B-2133 / 20Z) TaxID=1091494 RepID=G4T050_META2|nr:ATPase [Methylotuvimicrobium alcaliphilum]CCE23340.1 H+-transporting ATP synthase, subunit I (AtpI) [Methylotuvimicrobium alcaliphilum 20Z]